jgi:outer membrane protein OmpA-like peptidoglycan-associated protein
MIDGDDEDHDVAVAWSERSGRFLRRYLPYVVGLAAATGILWYGAVPQFRAAGWGNAVTAPDAVGTTAGNGVDLLSQVRASELGLGLDGVRAEVDDAVVTLRGNVPSQSARAHAVAAAGAVGGVTRVVDHLTVSGSGSDSGSGGASAGPSIAVAAEPTVTVSAEPSPTASGPTSPAAARASVTATADGIVLVGTVPTDAIRGRLVKAAEAAFAAGAVTDRMQVGGSADGAAVVLSGTVSRAAATALREAEPGLVTQGVAVEDRLVVAAGVAEQLSAVVKAHPILFDTDRATVRPKSMATLNRVAAVLLATPGARIEVQGHTDDRGDKARNRVLSTRRAQAVADYLVSRGVPARRLVVRGYGSSRPEVPNDTEAHQQLNRRIAFVER